MDLVQDDDRSAMGFVRQLPAMSLPWLISSTVHLAVMLVLGLGFQTVRGMARTAGPVTGLSLQVHLVSRSPLDAAQQGSGSDAIELHTRRYFPDESPATSPTAITASRTPAATSGG